MSQWHKTGCVLCAQNCGLEVRIEDDRMVKVRPDKDNPRSQGYACRKGLNVLYHQYPEGRLTEPLRRVGDRFEPISWERAIDEIGGKMCELADQYGPRCLAYMGGGSQGGHAEVAFALNLLRSMGSQYFYSSAGQEFSGIWWLFGRMLGKQYNVAIPDERAAEMLVGWGWNGMQSHQMAQARKVLKGFSKDPDRLLVVIDPRKSETAAIADIHLPVRPGTDALLIKAMIAVILAEGWENTDYIRQNVEGWDKIRPWFGGFDARAAIAVCQLDYEPVRDICRLMTTRRWCMHPDLGVYMGRHSTLNSYLMNILGAICGIFGVRGGNVIPGMVMPMGFHADERDPGTWRTVTTGLPPVAAGAFPPNAMPEEILSDHPDRLRAVCVSACNPLRAYADTTAYEKAFGKLDLLVVNDIVMSETARLAHYVLPCRSFYESWDATFFPWTYPDVYFQMRRPLVTPPGQCLEASQIFTLLADRLGLIPDIPDELQKAAEGDRLIFGMKLMEWAGTEPKALPAMPFVLAKTLGRVWDSAAKAALWGMIMTAPKSFRKNAARAGFATGPDQGDRVFQALLDNPQGLWVGRADEEGNMSAIRTPSGKIEVYVPEMEALAKALDAVSEAEDLKMPDEFPMILSAGRHMDYNINTMMRNPEWNKGKRACTIAISPADADVLGLTDGQQVRVTTEAGSEVGELEVSDQVRPGTVLIPHGFGLIYDGEIYGINVNRLTKNTHRDPIGTPLHRYVPCRVEAV
ncbi:molybdopterin dinucleotide-binding protein [Desulfonema ishimotonii]|uniref:Molybdopterin dinucleotide-binding protein n=1 Tax=Desulfonema ishimotonii TaxID=45657 RepID=A0A401G2V3_9BACT|nr:molybdopterin-dependent oxidoreductase [Desulfonema ishimotonii]GBC63554.1 molybdopterin dinucleotide-binding protein [Desulfonema ishimotonii]